MLLGKGVLLAAERLIRHSLREAETVTQGFNIQSCSAHNKRKLTPGADLLDQPDALHLKFCGGIGFLRIMDIN
ncbi:hypothetical protein D3C75_1217860 [compost metagenome]